MPVNRGHQLVSELLLSGAHLREAKKACDQEMGYATHNHCVEMADLISSQQGFIQALGNTPHSLNTFVDSGTPQNGHYAQLANPYPKGRHFLLLAQALLWYDTAPELAWQHYQFAKPFLVGSSRHPQCAEAVLAEGLLLAELQPALSEGTWREALSILTQRMGEWAAANPALFQARQVLLQAECLRVDRDHLAAQQRYQQALVAARQQQMPQDEVLIAQRAARHATNIGLFDAAGGWYSTAYWAASRWGAEGLCHQLTAQGRVPQYQMFAAQDATTQSASSNCISPAQLDLQGLIKNLAVLERSRDELDRLVKERTQQLHQAQQQLLDLAHEAGRAQVASAVLHNIGNVLTSIVTDQSLLKQQMEHSPAHMLGQLSQMLTSQSDLAAWVRDDPKGRQLPQVIAKLAANLESERQRALETLGSLNRSTEHIRHVLASQQRHAKQTQLVEDLNLADLIQEAVGIRRTALRQHGVHLVVEAPHTPWRGERYRLLQIVENLIGNAIEACQGVTNPTVQVQLAVQTDYVDIAVRDNGCGFSDETRKKIFTFGFTTKADGNGHGLHSCVVEAQAMGGSLSAHSDGPGQGAQFTLRLPRHR